MWLAENQGPEGTGESPEESRRPAPLGLVTPFGVSHGFLHKGLRRSLLTPRSSFSFFCHTQGFSPTTERARVEPRSQRETQRPAWLPPRPRAPRVPPASFCWVHVPLCWCFSRFYRRKRVFTLP